MQTMRAPILTLLLVFLSSCATPPDIKVQSQPGKHSLPFRPNERFILTDVTPVTDYTAPHPIIDLSYFLDGRRRIFSAVSTGTTDGYVTYLGRIFDHEEEGIESPITDEHIIQIKSGEQITVTGNTVNLGEVRLHPKMPSVNSAED